MMLPLTSLERRQHTSVNEVVLKGEELPIIGRISVDDIARWPSKITFGDYSHDSDPLLSTWIISSLMGGIGNEKLKEGQDDETYWTAENMETRFPGQITVGAFTYEIPTPQAGAGTAYPLGDFPASAPSLWVSFGSVLTRWTEIDQAFTVQAEQLPSPPTNKGVEYNNLFYIPCGTDGYATISPLGDVTAFVDYPVMAFCLWDNKLAGLTTDGQLITRFAAGAWDVPTNGRTLPSAAVPRNLVVYRNARGDPTLHAVTNMDLWAYSGESDLFIRTELQFPRHPDQGKASANWRGESLYVSVGLGIHAYNGGIVSAMGPDGRYGLPPGLRGVITDLEPEYNSLVAMIQGSIIETGEVQDVQLVPPMYQNPFAPFTGEDAYSCVLRWTTRGWHPVWQSPSAGGLPTWVYVSRADGNYRLWWGYGQSMYYQTLPYTFFNPKAGMRSGESEFAPYGSLTTGWFDADMTGFSKLASHAELVLDDVYGDKRYTGTVGVYFQVDNDPSWRWLGETDQSGAKTVFPFNLQPRESSDGFPIGQPFQRIRFRLDFTSADLTNSPIMESFQLKFKKTPISTLSFRFTVDLDQTEQYKGRGPGWLSRFLRSLVVAEEFVEFMHRDETFRVTVTQTTSQEKVGPDLRAGMTVNVLEVRSGDRRGVQDEVR